MSSVRLLRDYENPDLSLEIRLPSLARRFSCLSEAPGLDPFEPQVFHKWAYEQPPHSPSKHAALMVLNLLSPGKWEPFDALTAVKLFSPHDRDVLANWVRSWR